MRLLEFGYLAVDLALLLWVVRGLARLTRGPRELSVRSLHYLLIAVTVVGGWALTLGYFGLLRPTMMSLALACTGVVAAYSASRRESRSQRRAVASDRRRLKALWTGADLATRSCITGGVILFGICALVLIGSSTIIHDDLAYRLPRIAVWDHTHSIRHFSTGDPRMNYMPVVPDLIQWWVLSHFSKGYLGANVISLAGTVLVLGSMIAGGRLLRIDPKWSLTAWLLWLLLPPVLPQLATAQTDVWTAGLCTAGIYFLCRMWRTRRYNPWSPLAFALAFASKGTMYYLVPGLIGCILALSVFRRFPTALAARSIVSFALMFLALAGPRHLENLVTFGNPFGLSGLIQLHAHGQEEARDAKVFGANAAAFAVQNLDPNANPPFLRGALTHAASAAVSIFLKNEPPAGVAFVPTRARGLTAVFALPSPDGDTSSLGILFVVLVALCGAGFALRFTRLTRTEKALGFAVVVLFCGWWCVMSTLAWHPYVYRYATVVLAPACLGIVAAISKAPRFARSGGVMAILAWQACWAIPASTAGNQWGPMLKDGIGRSMLDYLDLQKNQIAANATGQRVAIACEYQMVSAGFLRTGFPVSEITVDPSSLPKVSTLADLLDELDVDVVVLALARAEQFPASGGVKVTRVYVTGAPRLGFCIAAAFASHESR